MEKEKSRKELAYDRMYDHLQIIYEEYHYKIKDEKFLNFIDKKVKAVLSKKCCNTKNNWIN